MINPIELIRANIRSLSPYSTARDEYQGELGIYLDANENPFDNGYNRYPDPYQKRLKARISEIKHIAAENIFVGNGSDEAIDLTFRVFCEPRVDNAVAIAPSYGMYKVAAAINDVRITEVALNSDYTLDVEKLLAATDQHTKLIFVCSPNNPSANSFPTEQLELILSQFRGLVVVDEAYIDFSLQKSLVEQIEKYPNLIVLQTLSKAWGMAGLRLGLAFAQSELIEIFTRVKYPYNINGITQEIVLEQLQNSIEDQVEEIVGQREIVIKALESCRVVKQIFPSDANFVLVRVDDPKRVYNILIEKGVIVRDRSRIKGCEGCLRITIGTPKENERMLHILQNIK